MEARGIEPLPQPCKGRVLPLSLRPRAGAPQDSSRSPGGPTGRPGGSAVEVEVARRLLLEPQPVVLRRLLQELRRLLEHVVAVARRGGRVFPRVLDRRRVDRDLGLVGRRLLGRGRRWLLLERRQRPLRGLHRLHGWRGGRRGVRELGAPRRAQRLLLLARDLFCVRAPAALELEVLPDGVVEQSHLAVKAYSALSVRFFPERFAR